MSDIKLFKDIEEKHKAKTVYDHIEPAFEHIIGVLHEKWSESKEDEAEGRERIWRMLHAMKQLRQYYLKRIKDGDIAELQLKRKENARARTA